MAKERACQLGQVLHDYWSLKVLLDSTRGVPPLSLAWKGPHALFGNPREGPQCVAKRGCSNVSGALPVSK